VNSLANFVFRFFTSLCPITEFQFGIEFLMPSSDPPLARAILSRNGPHTLGYFPDWIFKKVIFSGKRFIANHPLMAMILLSEEFVVAFWSELSIQQQQTLVPALNSCDAKAQRTRLPSAILPPTLLVTGVTYRVQSPLRTRPSRSLTLA
jgi:hypothetical protein